METSKRKMIDRDANSAIWYLFRDFGDIKPETSTDEKWKEIHSRAVDAATKYPDFSGMIGMALNTLEDRSIGEANAKERKWQNKVLAEETNKVMSLFRSLGKDDKEKILDMMRLYRNRS